MIEKLEKELLIAIRDHLSQRELAQRMGYSYNIVSKWETGSRKIDWVSFVTLCEQAGLDLSKALKTSLLYKEGARDYASLMRWITKGDSTSTIASKLGVSRRHLSRWLSGESPPRLTHVLRAVDLFTHSLVLFAKNLADTQKLPSIQARTEREETEVSVYYQLPYVGTMIMAFDLEEYRNSPVYEKGFFSRKIGISLEEEELGLEALEKHGLVKFDGKKYKIQTPVNTDTTFDPEAHIKAHIYWSKLIIKHLNVHLAQEDHHIFGNIMFSINSADYEKIRDLTRKYFRDLRELCDSSKGVTDTIGVGQINVMRLNDLNEVRRLSDFLQLMRKAIKSDFRQFPNES